MKTVPLVLAGLFAVAAPLHAQLVNDGATNTLANVTNTINGNVIVGTNGTFTLLVLSDNTLLSNSAHGVIGANATARSNEVRLLAPTARWQMANNLFVGSNGAASRLVVDNGAYVSNNNGFLGNGVASSNNLALVSGAGSLWTNRLDLTIGVFGWGNQLIISNGARVASRLGNIGQQPGGSNNLVVVTGSGSLWTNHLDVSVGAGAGGNRLVIDAGGFVGGDNGRVGSGFGGQGEALVTGPGSLWSSRNDLAVGLNPANNRLVVSNGAVVMAGRNGRVGVSTPATNNVVIITGAGSLWNNQFELYVGEGSLRNRMEVHDGGWVVSSNTYVGNFGSSNSALVTGVGTLWSNRAHLVVGQSSGNNRLVVSNSGTVFASQSVIIGAQNAATNSQLVVDGGTLRVTNAAGTGVLDVRRGAVSLRAGSVEVDRLVLTNVVGNFDLGGGTLITRGAAMTNIGGFNVSGSATNPAVWDVRAGAAHALPVTLSVGSSLPFNQMLITNGGMLTSGVSYIGSNAGSRSNLALISGTSSKWTAANLDVGNGGAFNRLIVSDGATVEDFNGSLGQNSGSSNNLAVVTGVGSLWTNRNEMSVGYQGSGNQLVISNGGTAFAQATRFIGRNSGVVSNTAIVTGDGSRWLGPGNLEVGGPAALSRLLVTDGGFVANNFGFIGSGASSSNNLAVIAGAGSAWSNAMEIHIGEYGDGNQLVVSDGGFVRASSGEIGSEFGSANNQVMVTGAGSRWNNTGLLYVGNYGVSNRLVIANGGAVYNDDGYIGGNETSSNNLAFVTGMGSVWSNAGSVLVGNYGVANQFIVSNGAVVFGYEGIVGSKTSSSNNVAMVTGLGSVWSNAVDLFIGNDGQSNQLIIFAGGAVRGLTGTLGLNSSSSNNLAIVSDAGSVWNSGDDLYIGHAGAGNQLMVSNGALLTNSGFASIGENAIATSNRVTLTGAGSRWWLGDGVLVGYSGSGNRLVVSNGAALVTASISYLGFNASSSNNEAVVTGPGTTWTNSLNFGLRVGRNGSNNRLLISDGALLSSYDDIIGENPGSSNNLALVTGVGSIWTNRGELHMGFAGDGNQLVISNGGAVFGLNNRYIGYDPGAASNRVIVTGAGSRWVGNDSLYVGADGVFNGLLVRNGGQVTSGPGTIGGTSTGHNNRVVVTDAGSSWTNGQDLYVGEGGRENLLVVSNGAAVAIAGHGFIGFNVGARSNTVVVADSGSRWLLSSNLYVGSNGAFSRLMVTNGARLENTFAAIGVGISGSNNHALITGAGSIWTNRGLLRLGESGRSNQMVVSNGGRLECSNAEIGFNASSSNNQVSVTSTGSFVRVQSTLYVGHSSGGNRLVVSDGAWLHDDNALIGYFGTNNEVIVTDPGTTWTNRSGIYVGRFRGGNRLTISNSAFVISRDTWIGLDPLATNNRVVVDGGTLLVTAVPGFGALGALDVQRGTNVLNAGLIDVLRLFVTNTLGQFEFNGGKLVSSGTTIGNGRIFTVGNGASPATFELRGGVHSVANGFAIATNAVLTGAGTVVGILSLQPGGNLSPGASVGTIVLSNSPALQGAILMEIGRTGALLTNDQIQVAAPLTYGGSLIVSNLGPDMLAAGDRFTLFTASSYSGAFASITLPTLPVTLAWTNKLAVDGSIEVIPYVPPPVELTIQLSNGVLRVSWPTNGADYCLETSYDLSPPISWRTVSSGITTNGASFVFSLANVGAAPKQFFRLAFPCSAAPVMLSLQLSNNLVTVSWPSNQFRLETTFNLAPPVTWQTLSNGINDSDGRRVLTITNNSAVSNQFFRLAYP